MNEIKNMQPMNVHIKVQNFGPIEKAEIDLRPLTVFVGESNTGKTYLAALIYALYGSFAGFARFPWSHHDVMDLHLMMRDSQFPKDKEITETLEKLRTSELPFKFSDLPQWIRSELQSPLNDSEIFSNQLKRCFDLGSVSDLVRFTGNSNNELKVLLKVCEKDQTLWSVSMQTTESDITVDGYINKDIVICPEDVGVPKETLDVKSFEALLHRHGWDGEKVCYLPAARSGLMQSHGVIASSLVERATRTGLERFREVYTFSGMIADFLQQIIRYKERNGSEGQVSSIAKALEDDLLHGQIEVKRSVPGGYPEFLYHPQQTKQVLQMSRVSAMVSELTPLVLFLRSVIHSGDTLIIEEPEAHLHPRGQTEIAFILARLIRAGVRVVVTTHSEWFIQQIGNLIREGELKKQEADTREAGDWLLKEEVGAWWFHRDKPVTEIPFDRIEGIEPSDYEDIADGLYNTFVELERQFLNEETVSENE